MPHFQPILHRSEYHRYDKISKDPFHPAVLTPNEITQLQRKADADGCQLIQHPDPAIRQHY
ncbi:MAG: hypothetical protein K2Y28_14130 [Burkholderiaceae bacterium]|nr:hypothetical protein [Burkholderiaceae bacterium]